MAEAPDCPICCNAIVEHPKPKATGVTKTSCGHSFHPGCLGTWYLTNTTCPCCRAEATKLEKPKKLEPKCNKERVLNAADAFHDFMPLQSQLDTHADLVNTMLMNANRILNSNVIRDFGPILDRIAERR